jgi:hypothetical protein
MLFRIQLHDIYRLQVHDVKTKQCRLIVHWRFRNSCRPNHQRRSKHLWNVGYFLPDYMALQPRRQQSSYSPPWETVTSQSSTFRKPKTQRVNKGCLSCIQNTFILKSSKANQTLNLLSNFRIFWDHNSENFFRFKIDFQILDETNEEQIYFDK